MVRWHFDTEAFLIGPGMLCPPPVCLSHCGMKGGAELLLPDDGAEILYRKLVDDDVLIVGHNVAYDFAVMGEAYDELLPLIFEKYDKGLVSDTQLRDMLIANAQGMLRRMTGKPTMQNPGRGFSMGAIMFRRFGENLLEDKGPDAWRLRYGTLAGIPLDRWPVKARTYALEDAVRTRRMFNGQLDDADMLRSMLEGMTADPAPFVQNERQQAAAAFALHLAGCWGLRTDPALVGEAARKIDTEITRLDKLLLDAGILRSTSKGHSRHMQAIFDRVEKASEALGIEVERTATGRVSAKGDVLLKLASADPLLGALEERQGFDGSRSKYLPILEAGRNEPITPRWNALVETGRTSCSKPPLQQLPKHHDPVGIRRAFVPRPGFVYAVCDYSTLELRALAQVCLDLFGDEQPQRMAKALRDGLDLHFMFAAWLLGVEYDDVCERDGNEWAAKSDDAKLRRKVAKAANFGFPGGLGAEKFVAFARKAYKVEIEGGVDGARSLKRRWLQAWPEVGMYHQYIADECTRSGDNFLAVQHRSKRLRGGCGYCDGANTFFQGLAADGAKAALWYVSQECYTGASSLWDRDVMGVESPLEGSRVVAFMHDEILIESPEDKAPEAGDRLSEIMIEAMQVFIPDVPIVAEPMLMRTWNKKAETLRDDAGRLLVYEDHHATP